MVIQIFISHAPADDHLVREFEKYLAPLKAQGVIQTRSALDLGPSADFSRAVQKQMSEADIAIFMASPDYLASPRIADVDYVYAMAGPLLVPVLVRPVIFGNSTEARILAGIQPLPRNGRPITLWKDQVIAWADVIAGLGNIIGQLAPRSGPTPPASAPVSDRPPIPIGDIFTISQPDINYVEPSQMPRLKAELGAPGPGLVVEGPSGIGKTTVVNQAFEVLGLTPIKLLATDSEHLEQLETRQTRARRLHRAPDDR